MPEHLLCGVTHANCGRTPGLITVARPAQTMCRRDCERFSSCSFRVHSLPVVVPGSHLPRLSRSRTGRYLSVRSHCEFRRHNRVYAVQGALVNDSSPPINASHVVACLDKQRMLRCERHSRTGPSPHAHSRSRMNPTCALIAVCAPQLVAAADVTSAIPHGKEGSKCPRVRI